MSPRKVLPVLLVAIAALIAGLFVAPAQAAYAYSPPSSFKAKTVANTYAVMSWASPSTAIDSFTLRYSTSSSMSNSAYRVPGKVTELQLNNLKAQTTYYAQVRARKSGKDVSDWSTKVSFKTTSTAFGAPSAPSFPADRIRKDSFKMQWGEVPNASRYEVQMSTNSTFSGAKSYFTHSNGNSFYIGRGGDAENAAGTRVYDNDGNVQDASYSKLQANTRYYVRVRALEAKKDGSVYALTGYSGSRSVVTNAWTVYPPQLFQEESATAAGITLSWQDVKDQAQGAVADSYRIQYWMDGSSTRYYLNTDKLASNPLCGRVDPAPGNGGTITLTLKKLCNLGESDPGVAFTAGKGYRFRVVAYAGGEALSDYTDSSGVYALASNEPLATPDDLRIDEVTDTSMTLSWKIVEDATSYRLQQKLGSSFRYLFDVCETGGTAPQVDCQTDSGRKSVTLTRWQDNSAGGASTNMSANQTYYIRIAAQKGDEPGAPGLQARASEYSADYLKVALKGWPYDPPEDVTVKTNDSTSVTLQWKSVNDPDGDGTFDPKHPNVRYRIQYSSSQTMGSPKYISTTTNNVTSLRIGGLANKKVYYFRIRAVDQNGSGSLSDYTEIGKPWTAITLGRVGKVHGTLNVDPGCSPNDYVLVTYWGDEVEDTRDPTTVTGQTATFHADGLLVGSAYNFHYEYTGLGNCVSTWVSNNSNKLSETHMLKSYATDYPLALSQDFALPTTTAFPGVQVKGTVTKGQNGSNNSGVTVTAFGGPQDGASPYREVHDMSFTGSSGTYELNGLWPNYKYKFYFSGGSSGLTSGVSTYSLWKNHITASDPGANFNVWLCNGVGGVCTPDSNKTGDGESSGGSYPGGFDYPVPGNLRLAGAASSSSIPLAWDAVAGVSMYRVQYSTSSNMSSAKYAGFHGTTGTLTGLKQGTLYYVRIAAVEEASGVGGSKLSDYTPTPYKSFSTFAYSGGYAYAIPAALTSTAQTSSTLTLDWGDVPSAPFYRVQYSTNSSMSGSKYAGFSASNGVLSSLTSGTKYYFRVAVVENTGGVGGSKLSDYTGATYPSATTD